MYKKVKNSIETIAFYVLKIGFQLCAMSMFYNFLFDVIAIVIYYIITYYTHGNPMECISFCTAVLSVDYHGEIHTQLIPCEITARKLCNEQQIKFSIYLFTHSNCTTHAITTLYIFWTWKWFYKYILYKK